jgi:hypothetical protein
MMIVRQLADRSNPMFKYLLAAIVGVSLVGCGPSMDGSGSAPDNWETGGATGHTGSSGGTGDDGGGGSGDGGTGSEEGTRLAILLTGNVSGFLEPCG